jgi:hypothetical protein
MPITIVPTIADITVGGITWTHADWEANTPGTISGIANAIGGNLLALGATTGSIVKVISGDTTLSGADPVNLVFVIEGALGAEADLNFPPGVRMAIIANNTTGGFALSVGQATGDRVTIPAAGSATVYSDGADFFLADGVARSAAGNTIAGTLVVGGAATLSSTLNVTGDATLGANVTIAGTLDVAGATTLAGTLDVAGVASFTSNLSVLGQLEVQLDSSFLQSLGVGGNLGVTLDIICTGDIVGVNVAARHASLNTAVYIDSPLGGSSTLEFANAAVPMWRVAKNFESDLLFDWLPGGVYTASPIMIMGDTGYVRLLNLPTAAPALSGSLWNNAGVLNVV